jgi:hypothetical protein
MSETPLNRRARKRERQKAEAASAEERFQFGLLAKEVLRQPIFADLGFLQSDVEVIPAFDGSPENMSGWLIFETRDQADLAKEPQAAVALLRRAQDRLVDSGFPVGAAATFKLAATSIPEIEAGGGRFHFFR